MTKDEIKQQIEEMYRYYMSTARKLYSLPEGEADDYEIGRATGAIEAISAIYLMMFGGQSMYELWQECIEIEEEALS